MGPMRFSYLNFVQSFWNSNGDSNLNNSFPSRQAAVDSEDESVEIGAKPVWSLASDVNTRKVDF